VDGLLNGKITLITGAGSGIGRATALAFAREGARVAAADLSLDWANETVALINSAGGEGHAYVCDVAVERDVDAVVKSVVQDFGRLDCAFNNAGIEGGPPGVRLHEYASDTWERVVEVDLKGVWLCMRYEIAAMLAQGGGGAIVNTSSIAGLVGGGNAGYVATKHGVIGLTRRAAIEYGRDQIRVNAVCPGSIRTPMLERLFRAAPERESANLDQTPLRRFGLPEEVAEAVVWLCSDRASFVTGHPLVVDGGWVAL
jgi:NAD(P)-dependent dehydrogenase (short-subunit alcohol dehydrogenase family)